MAPRAARALLRLKQPAFWQSAEHDGTLAWGQLEVLSSRNRGFMAWHGKVVGAVVGMVAGGPAGAAVGAFLGHLFDVQNAGEIVLKGPRATSQQVQEAFFRTTFQVMGHIDKAEGRGAGKDIQ